MVKIEVEHRGLLSLDKFDRLNEFLLEEGSFLGENKRFSLIYLPKQTDNIEELKDDPVDLRLRVTNKKAEVVLKYGKWGSCDSRREFSFDVDLGKFDDKVEFLRLIGFKLGIFQVNCTKKYLFDGIEFSLVHIPGWGYYFEAEILSEKENVDFANSKIKKLCELLGLKVVDQKEYCKLIDELNGRREFQFDFSLENNFSEIKKKYLEYF